MANSLSKAEILRSKKLIDQLVSEGQKFRSGCLLLYFVIDRPQASEAFPLQVLFSVPKKLHRKAVVRNLIKRRIREAHRINKHYLLENLLESKTKCRFMYVYIARDVKRYRKIEQDLVAALNHLAAEPK